MEGAVRVWIKVRAQAALRLALGDKPATPENLSSLTHRGSFALKVLGGQYRS